MVIQFPGGTVGVEIQAPLLPGPLEPLSSFSSFLRAKEESWFSLGQIFPLSFFKTHYFFFFI